MFLLKKPRYFYVMFFLIIIYETNMHIIFLKKKLHVNSQWYIYIYIL